MSCLKECSHVSRAQNITKEVFGSERLGEQTITFKTIEGIQRCIHFRSASVVKTDISIKIVRAGNIVVLDENIEHIRNTRDGTTIKLGVNSGVYTMDMCTSSTKQVQFSAGRDSEWSNRFRQACKASSIV